jgi:hypothetical protein
MARGVYEVRLANSFHLINAASIGQALKGATRSEQRPFVVLPPLETIALAK